MDERLPVKEYFRRLPGSPDGVAWLLILVAAIVGVIDAATGTGLLPLREIPNTAKTVTLLAFSPVLTFLLLVVMRQMPCSSSRTWVWLRTATLIVFFLLTNF